eukprot:TRINITY_DN90860_c0_g1_i1.p1 TRINITY_DN90860_c0_g1~~TRINITY_DN90860_c0_g1_i1.p1  ORF type:complete len:198 (-),score=24.60 TRINITY_DN90860_c0_g1_i1:118-711(-)
MGVDSVEDVAELRRRRLAHFSNLFVEKCPDKIFAAENSNEARSGIDDSSGACGLKVPCPYSTSKVNEKSRMKLNVKASRSKTTETEAEVSSLFSLLPPPALELGTPDASLDCSPKCRLVLSTQEVAQVMLQDLSCRVKLRSPSSENARSISTEYPCKVMGRHGSSLHDNSPCVNSEVPAGEGPILALLRRMSNSRTC